MFMTDNQASQKLDYIPIELCMSHFIHLLQTLMSVIVGSVDANMSAVTLMVAITAPVMMGTL